MECYRPTKALIDLAAIRRNTRRVIGTHPGYRWYTAVVKADCYGYRGPQVVQAMLDGGANSLAVSLVEEAVTLRETFPDVPILLFTPPPADALDVCVRHKLWVTVATLSQATTAANVSGLRTVIRANGGCDILGGPTDREGFEAIVRTLQNGACELMGVYLHNYHAEDAADTAAEWATFEAMTAGTDLSALPFCSICNSLSLPRYEKKPYSNGCRLGNILYAIESEDPTLEPTFRLVSRVLHVFPLTKGQSVAYSRAYTAHEDGERIAAVPIGFGDGFAKTNIGRTVFIHDRAYRIVAVTMDITLIAVDDAVAPDDEVVLIRDHHHLEEIAAHIHGATEEAICALNKRVPRIYLDA